ncbi:glycosyltransferase family 1 protein, partial [bacterium]
MHICFITSEFPKQGYSHGGVGTFVATLAKALVKQGIKVSVIGLNYINKEEIENIDGIIVYRVIAKKQKGLQWYFNSKAISDKIKKVHQQNPIDIIETAELGLAFLSKIKGIKYIIRLHGGHHFFAEGENRGIDWWKGSQEKRSFKKADAFIGVSHYVKNHTAKYLKYYGKPIEVIPNPICFKKFQPIEGINTNNKSIVFVGTVCEKKGVRQLIEAFQKVRDEFEDSILNIYGRDWFFNDRTSYISFLKKTFSDEQLRNVFFKGVVSHNELPQIYQQAEVCVFPSHIETQGLVAPEAMAMESIVIFSKTGPGPETIVDGTSGLLCNPHDPQDIAEKIKWVFNNKEESVKIGKQAREYALNKFDINI